MTQEEILDRQWDIDFGVAKSMRYHAYRRSFWEATDYWSKVITIISGTAVVVSIVSNHPAVSEILAFVVATFSAADVILGFSARRRLHDRLYREFCGLELDITDKLSPTAEDIAKWKRRRLEIEMEEPGVLDLLERRCAGEEARARGLPLRDSWKLSRWQMWLSQFSIFPGITQPSGER